MPCYADQLEPSDWTAHFKNTYARAHAFLHTCTHIRSQNTGTQVDYTVCRQGTDSRTYQHHQRHCLQTLKCRCACLPTGHQATGFISFLILTFGESTIYACVFDQIFYIYFSLLHRIQLYV